MSQEMPIRFYKGTGHRDAVTIYSAGIHHLVITNRDDYQGVGYQDGDASWARAERMCDRLECLMLEASRDMILPGIHPYHRIPR